MKGQLSEEEAWQKRSEGPIVEYLSDLLAAGIARCVECERTCGKDAGRVACVRGSWVVVCVDQQDCLVYQLDRDRRARTRAVEVVDRGEANRLSRRIVHLWDRLRGCMP